MNPSSKKIAQTAVLAIGVAAANLAWSCPNSAGTETSADANVSKADVDKARSLSASELYELLHDSRLHESDGLGDYVHNFQLD